MSDQLINAIYAIDLHSGIPLYRQLMQQTQQAIAAGQLKPQQQLPSVRALASCLQVNPMTISKAFSNLESEGVLVRKRGVGMLIAEDQKQRIYAQALITKLHDFVGLAKQQQLSDNEVISLVQQQLSVQNNQES